MAAFPAECFSEWHGGDGETTLNGRKGDCTGVCQGRVGNCILYFMYRYICELSLQHNLSDYTSNLWRKHGWTRPSKAYRRVITLIRLIEYFPENSAVEICFDANHWPVGHFCLVCGSTRTVEFPNRKPCLADGEATRRTSPYGWELSSSQRKPACRSGLSRSIRCRQALKEPPA